MIYKKNGFPLIRTPKFVLDTHHNSYEKYSSLPNTHFMNYTSFGLDVAITLNFHDQRTQNPSKFSSSLKNKFLYLNESCKYLDEFAQAAMWNLASYICLICDGEDLTDTIRYCHTLVILNIPGNLPSIISKDIFQCIKSNNFDRQDFDDKKIEVVASRIAQCNQLRIELCYPMTVQIDDESFYLPSSTAVNINHTDQILMLNNIKK
ncbi:hypothetical protein I4U23_017060 [Adineta vaga]|nr:hypothetical protein I4U23_017060 [Adineta vaga]